MAENMLLDLSQDIGQLFTSGDNYDLIIQAGEDQDMKEFFAHSLILGARSTYFKTALSKEWAKKENGIIIFKKPNISPEIMELILKYLYTGLVNFDKQNGTQMLKLLIASDELNLQKFRYYIQTHLIDSLVEYLKNDPVDILQIVFRYEVCEDLRKFCLDTICKNPKILFESPKFASLDKDSIILFLKKNELEMEEIEIWEFILKWALEKMSTQHNIDNLSQWTSSNFEELENILHDLIPHIRWFQIPAKLFWRKVYQFEPIFPKQLFKDIVGYHFDPDTPPINAILPLRRNLSLSVNSDLINKDHLSIIASWIDKKEKPFYDTESTPYLFKLLYRASRDGFEAAKFHELCDKKGSTIMISKLKENGLLIGGYNPLSWQRYNAVVQNNGTWQSTSDSFLFSFTKKEDINSAFISRVKSNQNYAVCYDLTYGPAFGGGWDLIIERNNIIRNYSNYTYSVCKGINSREYILEDYEVYQVVKK
jgi:hypothetical protein